MTNNTALSGNNTAASDDDGELYKRVFAEYSWAPLLLGSIAAIGLLLGQGLKGGAGVGTHARATHGGEL